MKKKNLNGTNVSFSRDERIKFVEETHQYIVDGHKEMTPVSTVYGKFFKPFDAVSISLKKCYGNAVAAARLREEWESKGTLSRDAGTFMHKQIENYLNDHVVPQSLICHLKYVGNYIRKEEDVDISREWSYFRAFDRDTTFTPFRTEWAVFDEEYGMAGTIDLICSRSDGTYELYDWKRSRKVDPTERNRWQSGINGLEHLTDTSYSHYCLQQNLYRYMLEKNYGIKVSRMNLVVLHPELSGYKIVEVPRMDREVKIILNHIK